MLARCGMIGSYCFELESVFVRSHAIFFLSTTLMDFAENDICSALSTAHIRVVNSDGFMFWDNKNGAGGYQRIESNDCAAFSCLAQCVNFIIRSIFHSHLSPTICAWSPFSVTLLPPEHCLCTLYTHARTFLLISSNSIADGAVCRHS